MNAYFQVINEENKTKLRLIPATEDGQGLDMSILMDYLNYNNIKYDVKELNLAVVSLKEEKVVTLCEGKSLPIACDFRLNVEEGNMLATGIFTPPSNDGPNLTLADIMATLRMRSIVYGIQEEAIEEFLSNPNYLQPIPLAIGVPPRHGKDAQIEYFFNTDLKAKPTVLEDGSVDFFNLNIINHCEAGDLLARLHPEDKGEDGRDICGNIIKPRQVKHETLRFGNNISLSEDRLEIYSTESGHVNLIDGRVFVTTVMELENVDTSTGNIEFKGNVQVNGNVCSNFSIHAEGNVEVRGVVEGAYIEAGGNITIARGMNGMSKGELKSGGNVIAKFLENAKVEAAGYVQAESMIHSDVMAGTEVVVNGKHGFISGGHVSATSLVDAKILGSEMGTDTVIEVGVSPVVKRRYKELGENMAATLKIMERAVPILEAARDKYYAGKELNESQIQNIRELAEVVRTKKAELKSNREEYEELDLLLGDEKPAQVLVGRTVYPGTKIIISDVSKIVKESVQYCKFIRSKGDVKMVSR